MDTSRRNSIRWLIAAGAGTLLVQRLNAQVQSNGQSNADAPWPSRPLRLVVTAGPGGVADVRARWLAERLAPALGQRVVIDYKAGAGGSVGMAEVARSAPDGYTLVVVHQGTMAVNPHLYPRLGYEPLIDFTPITRLGVGPLLLAVHPELPARSVAELVALAKARPGQLKFGTPGIGTPPHMASELFLRLAGIAATHVPYKGGGDAVRDLIGGHLNFSIEGFPVQLPQVKAGRLRALAVTGGRRSTALPDIPTLAESGVAGYEYTGWVGLAAPAGTPKPVIARLYDEIAKIYATAEAREWFASFAAESGGHPPDEFAAFIRAEYARLGQLIRDAGIKPE